MHMPLVLKPFQTEGDLITHVAIRGQTTLALESKFWGTTMRVDGRHSCMSPRSAPALGLDLLRQNEPFRSPLDQCASTNRHERTRYRMSSCNQKVQWLPRNTEHYLRADRLSCLWWKSDSLHASNPIDDGIILNDISTGTGFQPSQSHAVTVMAQWCLCASGLKFRWPTCSRRAFSSERKSLTCGEWRMAFFRSFDQYPSPSGRELQPPTRHRNSLYTSIEAVWSL